MPQHLCVIIKNYVKQFDGEKVQFSKEKFLKKNSQLLETRSSVPDVSDKNK